MGRRWANHRRDALCAGAAAAAFGLASPGLALAQEPPRQAAAAEPTTLGDVVVTARRREERLQDVPVAITALSGEALDKRGIVNVQDLAKTTPGLNIVPSSRGGDSPYVTLRGQRVVDTSIVFDPPVIFYVNEVPWMRLNGLNQGLYDIENVQVLRGPQGTQFGKSTTGGAILVNTAPASTAGNSGYVKLTGGDFALRRAEGAVNVAVSDNLAIRLAGTFGRRHGYMNVRNFDYDMNNEHYDGERLTIRFESGDFSNDFYASRFSSKTHATANPAYVFDSNAPFAKIGGFNIPMSAEVARSQADFYGITLDPGFKPKAKVYTEDFTDILTWRISSNLTLKNIAAYRRLAAPYDMDFDGTQLFISPTSPGAYIQTAEFFSFSKIKQYSEELQLQGSSRSLDWTVGGFYFQERGDDGTTSFQGGTPTLGRFSTVLDARNISYSAFATGTYRFGIDGLSLSAGARVTRDKRRGTDAQNVGPTCGFTLLNGAKVCSFLIETAFTRPSWSVSLNYKLDPSLLVYLAHRHGYRSGGVQNRATSEASATPFRPETVNDVEFGVKFDRRIGDNASLILNADVYRANYKGLQRSVSFVSPTNGTYVTGFINAAQAKIQGLEAEGTLRLGNFEFGANIGYTDANYKKYQQALTTGAIQDLSDLPLGFVPKWTTQLRASYSQPLSHADEALTGAVMYQSVSKLFSSESIVSVGAFLPGYHTWDAKLTWANVGGRPVDLSALVTNFTDEKYYPYATNYSASYGMSLRFPAAPRRFEVSATYHF
jgi:iron complex outermembrane receptor protein